MDLFLVRIDGVSRPPEIELQRLLPQNPAFARRIACLVRPRWIDEFVRVRQTLHIDNEVIDPRVGIGPSHHAPHTIVSFVVALGDGYFADIERIVERLIRPTWKLTGL